VREVCIACCRTRQEIVEHEITGCDGTPQYREWLKDGVWVRQPIEPTERRLHAALDQHFAARSRDG
jgi:hypothetical protein